MAITKIARQAAALGAAAMVIAGSTSGVAVAGDVYGEPVPYRGSTKDDGYPVPQPPPAVEHAPPPAYRHRTSDCLSKFGIREALNAQGWHNFDDVELRGDVAYLTARRDDGRRFALEIDSCSGDVIVARPVYAYRDAPYRPHYYYDGPRPAVGFYYGGGYHRHWR